MAGLLLAVVVLPPVLLVVLGSCTLSAIAIAVVGLVRSHLLSSNHPPTRQVMAVIATGWRPGDIIEDATANFSVHYTLQYYADRTLRQTVRSYADARLPRRHRVWLIAAGRSPTAPPGFHVLETRYVEGDLGLSSELLRSAVR